MVVDECYCGHDPEEDHIPPRFDGDVWHCQGCCSRSMETRFPAECHHEPAVVAVSVRLPAFAALGGGNLA